MGINTDSDALIIFVRNPVLGKVKTRLARDIGDVKALETYKQLLHRTLQAVKSLTCAKFVFYSDSIIRDDLWKMNGFVKKLQSGETLGEKMKNAFLELFEAGYKRIIIIGSDCPDLKSNDIIHSFEMLQAHDIVIGPALDGGYYLLGMKALNEKIFNEKPWGTARVFSQTVNDIHLAGLSCFKGRVLNDIDNLDDLKESELKF